MLKVALTGGIATGKSHVLAELRRRGIPCLDADELAHGVMAAGTEATAEIAARFGEAVLDASGAVNRKALGAVVFRDASARRELEAIVHPAVYRAIAVGFKAFARLGDAPLVVADIPLLYESGRAADFSRVIATVCAPDIQRARLLARGLTSQEADERLAAQMPSDQKAAKADYVINTDGTFVATSQQIDHILAALRPDILTS